MPLESRKDETVKNAKSNKKAAFVVLILFAIVVFLVIKPPSKKEACDCVNTYNKWDSAGAGFGIHSSSLKNELDRCRRRFDGINNARRKCNE